MMKQRNLLFALCAALVLVAVVLTVPAEAGAVEPAGQKFGKSSARRNVAGTVVAKSVCGDSRTGIKTVVSVAGTGGLTTFEMEGGETRGIGLWTEYYTAVNPGDRIAAVVSKGPKGTKAIAAPVVVGGIGALGVNDYVYPNRRWAPEDLPVAWSINWSAAPGYADYYVHQAAETWSNDPESTMQFVYIGATGAASETSGKDGQNVVGWTYLSGDELAHCRVWYDYADGTRSYQRVREFDITFNTRYRWSGSPNSSSWDIQSVALHELGHSLFLDDMYHDGARGEIMFGRIAAGALRRSLGSGDLAGLRIAYPPVVEVDNTPPTLSSDLQDFYDSPPIIRIAATDAGGVKRVGYSLNNNPWTWVDGDVAYIECFAEGAHTVTYGAEDMAGNRSEASGAFEVADTGAPCLGCDVGDSYAGEAHIRVSATDPSGVSRVGYSLDGQSWVWQSGSEVDLWVGDPGHHTLEFAAEDAWGNRADNQAEFDVLSSDTTPPDVHVEVTTLSYGRARVLIAATDDSGIAGVNYTLGTDHVGPIADDWIEFEVEGQGPHLLEWRVTDGAGNVSSGTRLFVIAADTTPPISHVTVTRLQDGTLDVRLTATDAGSGVERIMFSIDDGPYQQTDSYLITEPGWHTISHYAIDRAGNVEADSHAQSVVVRASSDITSPRAARVRKLTYRLTGSLLRHEPSERPVRIYVSRWNGRAWRQVAALRPILQDDPADASKSTYVNTYRFPSSGRFRLVARNVCPTCIGQNPVPAYLRVR